MKEAQREKTVTEPAQPSRASAARPVTNEEALLGRELRGRYQLLRELGRGGMGIVFLARDLALHRMVAIKVLRGELMAMPEERERFRREARLTARLVHANIVAVHGFAETRDLMYIVMQYVDGEPLAERLKRVGRLASANVSDIMSAIALALDYAHREGVVHRDLTATNILLERETGNPVITDFGVAALPSADHAPGDPRFAFGTPHYMSPEQAAGEVDIDGRSDIYALGVLGYAMLSGELPFDGPSFRAIAAKHIAEPLVPLRERVSRVPAGLATAIERCLAKERTQRWRRGSELREELQGKRAKVGIVRAWVAAVIGMVATMSVSGIRG